MQEFSILTASRYQLRMPAQSFRLPEEADSQFGCSPRLLTQDWWLGYAQSQGVILELSFPGAESRAPGMSSLIVCTHQIELRWRIELC
jgi:hypothetical protein